MEVFTCPISLGFSDGEKEPIVQLKKKEESPLTTEEALLRTLEKELRKAKSAELDCGEVLLPCDLLPNIVTRLLQLAEDEPRGVLGCKVFIHFEGPGFEREIGKFMLEGNIPTSELHLTLKEDTAQWRSKLPQFIKNLTRSGPLVISAAFTVKMKRSYDGWFL